MTRDTVAAALASDNAEGMTPLRKPAPAVPVNFPLLFEFGYMVDGVNGAPLAP